MFLAAASVFFCDASRAAAADYTAPSVSLTSPSNGSTVSGTITLSASATDNSAVKKVEFYRDGSLLVATDSSKPYKTTLDTKTLSDGSHTFMAKAYDAAGNVGTSATVAVTVSNVKRTDTTPPIVYMTSPANGGTVSGTITLSANASDNVGIAKVEFYRDSSVLVATDTTASYAVSFNTTGVANGSHTLFAKAYDAAGNVKASSIITVTVSNSTADTTPPSVAVTSPANGTSVSGTITLSASASDNVGVAKVEFYRDSSVLVATDTTASYAVSFNTTGVANGSHSFLAKAYDAVGNVKASSIVTVTVSNSTADTTPPSVSMTAPANGGTVSGTITLSASASDNVGVAKVEFYRDSSVLVATDTTASYAVSFNTTGVANGSHTFFAKAYDAVGNVKASSIITVTVSNSTADTTPPSVSMTAPANGGTVSGTITLSASASDNVGVAKVEFYRDSSVLVATDTTASYTVAFNTTAVANGSHTFFAKAYDAAGNVTTAAAATVTVGNCSYAISPSSTSSSASGGTGSVTVTATDGCIWMASSGASWISITSASSGTGNGVTHYSVQANTSTSSRTGYLTIAGKTFTVSQAAASGGDTTLPSVAVTAPTSGSTVSSTVTVAASASDNVGVSRVEFFCGSTLLGTDTTSPYSAYCDSTRLANGSVTYTAKAYDAAGNTKTAVCTVTVNNTVPGTWPLSFGHTGTEAGQATAIDSDGNILVVGYFQTPFSLGGSILTNAGGYDIFIGKFSPSGDHLWSKRYGGAGDEIANAITVGNGEITLAGYFTGAANFGGPTMISAGQQDAFIARYTSEGTYRWSKSFGGSSPDVALSVAADSQGNAVVTGFFRGSVQIGATTLSSIDGGTDTFLAKFSPAGTPLWAKSFFNADADYGRAVAVDRRVNPATGLPYDTIVVAGYYLGFMNFASSAFDANLLRTPGGYAAKFSPAGDYIWAKGYGTSGSAQYTRFWTTALDSNGDVWVGGDFFLETNLGGGIVAGQSWGRDMFLAKYSGVDGTYRWASPIFGFQASAGQPTALAIDGQNSVFLAACFQGKYTFGSWPVTSNSGTQDGVVAKFSSTGGVTWAVSLSGGGVDALNSVAVGTSGKPAITGYFSGSASLGGKSINSAGSYDAVVSRLDQ